MDLFGKLYLEHYQYHLQDSISVCARQQEQIQALASTVFLNIPVINEVVVFMNIDDINKHDYFLVVDLEATYDDEGTIAKNQMEIIEISAVIVNAENLDIVDEL